MIVTKLVPAPTSEPWHDPTVDDPLILVPGEGLGAAHGVELFIGTGSTERRLRVTQYRVGPYDWRFRIEAGDGMTDDDLCAGDPSHQYHSHDDDPVEGK